MRPGSFAPRPSPPVQISIRANPAGPRGITRTLPGKFGDAGFTDAASNEGLLADCWAFSTRADSTVPLAANSRWFTLVYLPKATAAISSVREEGFWTSATNWPSPESTSTGSPFSVHDLSKRNRKRTPSSIGLRIRYGNGTMLRSAVTICCLLYLAGCKTSGGQRSTAGGRAVLANPTDATMVSKATIYLRERLNAGACDPIYSEASKEFRGSISGEDWRRACEELRSTLGLWKSSIIRSIEVWHSFLASEDGLASFSGGSARFNAMWLLENGRATLVALRLESAVGHVVIPPNRLIDPPPRLMDPAQSRYPMSRGVPATRS
jgi:hypothetical protein